jgi:hypothetical protein
MSLYNPQVDDKYCRDCNYLHAPYISLYGTYTPCLECLKGNNCVVTEQLEKTKEEDEEESIRDDSRFDDHVQIWGDR